MAQENKLEGQGLHFDIPVSVARDADDKNKACAQRTLLLLYSPLCAASISRKQAEV